MICPYCGNDVDDSSKFCPCCGAEISGTEVKPGDDTSSPESPQPTPVQSQQTPQNDTPQSSKKSKGGRSGLAVGIIYIVAGVLLLSDGMVSITFDWGLLALCAGAGMLVMGILKVRKTKEKTISIISIVCGAIMFVLALLCASGFDWTYIGYATAILMLASGILGMTKVSVTDTSVVEIVISVILLILGFMCMNYIWGDIAFFVSISFIIRAIVNIVSERKQKS